MSDIMMFVWSAGISRYGAKDAKILSCSMNGQNQRSLTKGELFPEFKNERYRVFINPNFLSNLGSASS